MNQVDRGISEIVQKIHQDSYSPELKAAYEGMYDRYLTFSLHDRTIIKMLLQYKDRDFLEFILDKEREFLRSYGDDEERLLMCMSHKAQKYIKVFD